MIFCLTSIFKLSYGSSLWAKKPFMESLVVILQFHVVVQKTIVNKAYVLYRLEAPSFFKILQNKTAKTRFKPKLFL